MRIRIDFNPDFRSAAESPTGRRSGSRPDDSIILALDEKVWVKTGLWICWSKRIGSGDRGGYAGEIVKAHTCRR